MKAFVLFLATSLAALAQMPGQMSRFQPNYDDVKAALGLTDDQVNKLKQLQQDKMTATQSFYSKMADKQKELNQLLETNSQDAAKIGQIMLDLQQMRKSPPAGVGDTHEKAVAELTAEQKKKLAQLEEAQKMRQAVDQAVQLALLSPPTPAKPAAPQPVEAKPKAAASSK